MFNTSLLLKTNWVYCPKRRDHTGSFHPYHVKLQTKLTYYVYLFSSGVVSDFTCESSQYTQCGDIQQCYNLAYECDGENDCTNGHDESLEVCGKTWLILFTIAHFYFSLYSTTAEDKPLDHYWISLCPELSVAKQCPLLDLFPTVSHYSRLSFCNIWFWVFCFGQINSTYSLVPWWFKGRIVIQWWLPCTWL